MAAQFETTFPSFLCRYLWPCGYVLTNKIDAFRRNSHFWLMPFTGKSLYFPIFII